MSNEVAKVELSQDIIKKYIAPKATEQEIYFFLQLCKAQNLNPFLREVYLIKYKDGEPASIVTGKDLFLKRATRNTNYEGFRAGVIVGNAKNEITYREGGVIFPGEKLIGGWADVLRKDRAVPTRSEVLYDEYVGMKPAYKDGKPTGEQEPNRQWAAKPGTMIRKVALVQALREAFPDELEGLYSPEEFPHIEIGALPVYDTHQPAPGYIQKPQEKTIAETQNGNGISSPDPENVEPSVKDLLHEELSMYSMFDNGDIDMEMYKSVCTEVSTFPGKDAKTGKEEIKSFNDPYAKGVSDKWAGAALGKLREKVQKGMG